MKVSVPAWHRVLAAVGLVAASPVVLLAAVVVRLTSRGPAFYRATRIGRGGTPFTMWKLRSMRDGSDRLGEISGGRDPRITPVGRILRRLKIDEIPQLMNVVRGEMALVGPRPEAPGIVENHYSPWMMETLEVPPGIVSPGALGYFNDETDLPSAAAGVEAHYIEVSLPLKLACDWVYVRRRSTRYDLELIVRTLLTIIGLSSLFDRRMRAEREAAEQFLRAGEDGRQ